MPFAAVALAATLQGACPPSGGLNGICGPVASEDLARIGSTSWLIASGLNVGSPAHLYLIDTRNNRARPLFPQGRPRMRVDASYQDVCPSPPKLEAMSLDGLAIRPATRGKPAVLLAANHGDRQSIEVFRIDGGSNPSLSWIGCVPMPKGTLPNGVVALADGGLIATSFRNPDLPPDEISGGVWEWHRESGWHRLPIGDVPGANGIALSPDERTVVVSAWSARRLLVLSRSSPTGREIPLDFLPDNLHWTPDGSLLVAGQRAKPRDVTACGPSPCPQEWAVARVDLVKATVTLLMSRKGDGVINYVCGAFQVDDKLYLTLRGAPRVAWVKVADLH